MNNESQTINNSEKKALLEKYFETLSDGSPAVKFNETDQETGSYDAYPTGFLNRCIVCGLDLGEMNPRQFCNKTHCGSFT